MRAIVPTEGGVLVHVKAVPGARSDQIAGMLGDRLKVRISAPPEGGKANRAIAELLARSLGIRARDVTLVKGPASAEKTFRLEGIDADRAASALGLRPD